MLIYTPLPPTKSPKIIRRLHPLALRLHLLPRRCITLHPICLFVRPFVCSFGWLLRRLSAPCCCVPSRLVATPRHCATSHLSSSVSLSRCHVLSCLIIVLRPLMHLIMPALFDCCVYCCHCAATATVAVAVPPPPPLPCRAWNTNIRKDPTSLLIGMSPSRGTLYLVSFPSVVLISLSIVGGLALIPPDHLATLLSASYLRVR
jgi:hypothetical protein